MAEISQSMPVGVVIRKQPGVTRWARWVWRAVAVLPGAGPADWRELRRDGGAVEYHAATTPLELHRAETEGYLVALSMDPPTVFVVLRPGAADGALEVLSVTASAYEAQDYQDSGEEIVEPVPAPPGLVAWISEFVRAHHEDEVFVKRKRDRKRIDAREDGIGDARVRQTADVYRPPAQVKPKRTVQ